MSGPTASKVRLEEVAQAAEVSAATVSRVMNSPDLVSEVLRARVEKAAAIATHRHKDRTA